MSFFTKFFSKLKSLRPTPFKTFQRKMEIENEWAQLKSYLKPHKYKFLFVFSIGMLPYYKPILYDLHAKSLIYLSQMLQPNQPAPQIAESFGKQLITGIFHDQDVKRESGQFVEDLVKQQIVIDSVLELLIHTLKDKKFNDQSVVFSKQLLNELLDDKQVQQGILDMLLKLLRDQEFKTELQITVKELFSDEQTQDAVGDLLGEAITKEPVKKAFAEVTSYTLQELLLDKNIEEKLRIYIYYFIESDDVKKIIDKYIQRAVKGGRAQESKQSEFDKLINKDNQEIIENLKQRLEQDAERRKKFFIF